MREGSSRVVVLNVSQVGQSQTHYSRSFIRGLGDELLEHGYILLIRYGPTSAELDQQVMDAIAPREVLALGSWYFLGRELDDGGWDTGMAANSQLQIDHLHHRGHTDIAIAFSDSVAERPLADVRIRFAREGARRLGIRRPLQLVMAIDPAKAKKSLQRFRDAHPEVTAVATVNDSTATRVLRAMYDLNLSAPDDLAVIGFDESPRAAVNIPSLTTVHIDGEGHGRIAAREILDLDHSDIPHSRGRIVVRDST